MREVTCRQCGRSVPMNDSVEREGSTYCATCAEEQKSRPDVSWIGARPGVDPTICAWCRRDNGSTPLPNDGVAPVCDACNERHLHHPFPGWIFLFLVLAFGLAAGAMVVNARFYGAWIGFRAAQRDFGAGRFEQAASRIVAAAARVPESTDLAEASTLFQGFSLVFLDRSAEAVPLLRQWVTSHAEDTAVGAFLLQAEIGAAYDARDYALMYEKAAEMRDRSPDANQSMLQLASAAACRYAETGDERFRREAETLVNQVRARAPAEEREATEEYIARILHRLSTREIIDKNEYDRRFPGQSGSASS